MSDSELHDALTDIRGIGESTADTILDVVGEHTDDGEQSRYLDKAIQAANAGNDRKAAMYLRRANE